MEKICKNHPTFLVLFLACLAINAEAGKLKTGKQSEVIRIGKPLVLSCQADTSDETKLIEWYKKDGDKEVKVDSLASLKGRYSVKVAEGHFIIEKPNETDEGDYVCKTPSDNQTITVSITLIVKIPENIYVVEGEKLEINCIVKGKSLISKPHITWSFKKENENSTEIIDKSTDRIKLSESDDIDNAKLTIEQVEKSDRGFFSCIGNTTHMNDEVKSEGLVRVKDKFAAFWPFIGICAEVFVLCAIILIYEKRRNKDNNDDSDTDQGDKKN